MDRAGRPEDGHNRAMLVPRLNTGADWEIVGYEGNLELRMKGEDRLVLGRPRGAHDLIK